MAKIKIFVQARCARCPQAKQVGAELAQQGYTVLEYDVGTADGLAEAQLFSVQATPSIIVEADDESVLGEFRAEIPTAAQVAALLGG